jgi:hypothetical protein
MLRLTEIKLPLPDHDEAAIPASAIKRLKITASGY